MARVRHPRLAFNRGLVDPLAGARQDLERLALSADVFYNYTPRKLGPMSLRVGTEYIGNSHDDEYCKNLRFIRSDTSRARLELTEGAGLRVWIDDELVTRPEVTASIQNGSFASDLANWTDHDESGATSEWTAPSYLSLRGNGTEAAIREQEVTCNEPDVEHAIDIVIERGPVVLRVGSTAGNDDYIDEVELATGHHSLAFTPSGNFFVRFKNARRPRAYVNSVQVAAAGVMEVPAPWDEEDLHAIRYEQSADVVYVGCEGYQQRRIERRGDTSWSVVVDEYDDGPFRLVNTTETTLSASGISGDITLTASTAIFKAGHVGALFRMTSGGQLESRSLTAEDQFTDPVRVVGVGGQRALSILITGTWTATITLQMSVEEPGAWVDVETYTTNQAISYTDDLDEQIIYYRIGIKAGDYGSGTAVATLVHTSGVTVGVMRITEFTNGTTVSAAVLDTLGAAATATADWNEGAWSNYRGWPNVPVLFEGRLWHWGRDKVYGSISELYDSHDDTEEGDTAPIQRSLGDGPIETVHWVAPLMRMVAGVATMSANVDCGMIEGDAPIEARSSSFDEPLTGTNFNTKRASASAVYVDSSGIRLFEIAFSVDRQAYGSADLNLYNPGINAAGITVLGVQNKPDLRIHCRRNDGATGILVFDRVENVICWYEFITNGDVEDVCVLPGDVEDQVYYTVKRTINGAVVRFHEKMALESECQGGIVNKQADAFVYGNTMGTIAITDVTVTGSPFVEHSRIITTAAAHGLAVDDEISISGVVASGSHDVNGYQTVRTVLSATSVRLENPKGTGGWPSGSYVSGGVFASGSAATFGGLDHLIGETVVAWGDGRYLGDFVVDNDGNIDLGDDTATSIVAGLPYTARWQSTRNAIAEALGIGAPQKLEGLDLILRNTHASGVRFGQDFENMRDMPQADLPTIPGPDDTEVPDEDHVYVEHEGRTLTVDGEWMTNSRLCLESRAPKPATILCAIAHIQVNP